MDQYGRMCDMCVRRCVVCTCARVAHVQLDLFTCYCFGKWIYPLMENK